MRSLRELALAYRHARREWDPRQTLLGRDRRIFHRVDVRGACRMDNRLFGLQSDASLTNLSLGGAGLEAPVSWPEGTRIHVHFLDHGFKAEGILVFRREAHGLEPDGGPVRYGVKFAGLGLWKVWQLRSILKKNYTGPLAVL